ncbi:MAG TPA: hydroxymethylpyrimidine/phosphomethylpyrimidine kinase [Steroidobacteraceae bacterium]|nr:hydroxymethylpyrimidine/phosphomethylpyrimidine kinase [Steroidobacteraceae bacterium]
MTEVLVIAGIDPSGGAGLARDIDTLTRLGVRACCAVTAVTAQSDREFRAHWLLPAEWVASQIEAALANTPAAVKIGMLGSAAIVASVARVLLAAARQLPLVLDPVLRSSSGGELLDTAGRGLLLRELLPHARLLTPNIPEAAVLLGAPCAVTAAQLLEQAHALLALGAQAVLLKGGHAHGAQATDLLLLRDAAPLYLSAPRLPGTRRGTGCALASAIAAQLACGADLPAACARAKEYISERWRADSVSAPRN